MNEQKLINKIEWVNKRCSLKGEPLTPYQIAFLKFAFADSNTEAKANEKLIAAAPELLECAIKVMELLEDMGGSIVPHLLDDDSNDGQRLRDAIKKATE